jgi:hypothetical protein
MIDQPTPSPEQRSTAMDERRAPVQESGHRLYRDGRYKPPGTVSWTEHEEAWRAYAKRYGHQQSAERIAERGGFSRGELVTFLGREPATFVEHRP